MTMTPTQREYAGAKALYDTEKSRTVSEPEQAEAERQYWAALDRLQAAENNLITEARRTMQESHPGDYERVKICFEKPIYNLKLRQQLIDLCFRLKHEECRR